jgi:hypothetical protein
VLFLCFFGGTPLTHGALTVVMPTRRICVLAACAACPSLALQMIDMLTAHDEVRT